MERNELISYYAKNATLLALPAPEQTPRGILLLVHGMGERKERYQHVLSYFAAHEYICAISDLRGHGERAKTEADRGYFGTHGDKRFVSDVYKTVCRLRQDFPGLPLILFGHSMGSLIVRAYTKQHDDTIDGLFVCGCPSNNPASAAGKRLIAIMAKKKGWRYHSTFVQNLVSGSFDSPFKKKTEQTAADSWLCTDPAVVEAFEADPMCGFAFTLNGYYSLMNLMGTVYSKDNWQVTNPALPIHFMSGAEDPCRNDDKHFYDAVNLMTEVGYEHVTSHLYPNMRHELLNEPIKEQVMDDMLVIMDRICNA